MLTDTSPADVPIVVSNDGFYQNLRREGATVALSGLIEKLIRENSERYTVPYRYRIRLTSTTSRQLSLVHPAAQFKASSFYKKYSHLIPYFCRNADVSIRRPEKIGSSFFYLTRSASRKHYKGSAIDLLLQDKTVRNPGSFFAYAKHDRFYKFFGSEEFVHLEKCFQMMRLSDVAKCFSSIYSHTMAWAVKDILHGKESTAAISFSNEFDSLMQFSNYNETNGIPVGAELSRIFAEIILQAADTNFMRRAKDGGLVNGRDFAVRRYVDDYVIFANNSVDLDSVQRGISDALSSFNLHLNDSKTYTVSRPLQTKKSQIVSQIVSSVVAFRGQVSEYDQQSGVHFPARVRNPAAILGSLVNDMKVACVNEEVGYDEVSPYVIGTISNTIEALIDSCKLAFKRSGFDRASYVGAFEALLSALYFFFTVHITVASSYRVAKATILSLRFFEQQLPQHSDSLHEIVRLLIADVVVNPALHSVILSDCVPIEVLNIILASSELPLNYRPDLQDVRERVLADDRLDYFSVIALLFYYEDTDVTFVDRVQKELSRKMLPRAAPRRESRDAHFMLDLIACPYLSEEFRTKVLNALYKSLEMPLGPVAIRLALVREIQMNPWFVNWKQIDLLNHLKKKELSSAY